MNPDIGNHQVLNASERLLALHEDVADIKGALRDLTAAITKLALIEQQQTHAHQAQERAFRMLDAIETRLKNVELQLPMLAKTSTWSERLILAAAGASLMFVAKGAGFFS
jgi:hypothetical protein